jgi:hypothetical protein
MIKSNFTGKFYLIYFLIPCQLLCFPPSWVNAQTTDIVLLNPQEAVNLRVLVKENAQVRAMYDSINELAILALAHKSNAPTRLFYEGMLPTHPDRVATEESLLEMDMLVNLIYAFYGDPAEKYGTKAKQFVLEWTNRYIPTGNPINENKLTAIFWAYHIFNDSFTATEQHQVEEWMKTIAYKELAREKTPNNNWEAKRLKIIAAIGSILGLEDLSTYAIEGFKKYIESAYYADGTSNDLRERDALRYHVSGLIPTVTVFVNGLAFDSGYDLYRYTSPSGSSIERSVDYVIPYATGELQRAEWTNSKAAIDRKRAEAGLAEYQPGILYDPSHAILLLEWVGYFRKDVFALFGGQSPTYTASWVGFLNSPLIRSR